MTGSADYEAILEKLKSIAYSALFDFITNLGLEPSAFSHVYNTKILIDETGEITDGASALYNPNGENEASEIYVNIDYLDDLFEHIEDGKDESLVYLNGAATIVHELIHSLRVVMQKKEISKFTVYDQVAKSKNEEYIDELDRLLVYSALKYKAYNYKYIPIKVKVYKKNSYTLIVYNQKTKKYEVYSKKYFTPIYKGNLKTFFEELVTDLIKSGYAPDDRIPSKISNQVDRDLIYNSMDLYNSKEKELDVKYIYDVIDGQIALEEAFTEALSNIIIMSRGKEINLEKYVNAILRSDIPETDVKTAAYLIKKGDIDLLKEFFLAPYMDEYTNVFNNFFGEDYDEVLEIFYDLYENTISGQKSDLKEVLRLKEIIDSKIKRL